jgi:hypothetical protein
MNDATVMGAAQVDDVRAYVTAVRAWLADLPADEVEELTAGMEADLAERAAESGGSLGVLLGKPEAYAAELRSAAGLPPRADVVPDAVPHEPWTDRLEREARELLARQPWLRELRPTWWLTRGAVAGWVLSSLLGSGRVLLPLVGAALSVWLGLGLRGREPLGPGWSAALGVANALGVVLLLPMLASYSAPSGYSDAAVVEPPVIPGLVSNGQPVSNVYAYDAAGHRIDDVRLFDQLGQPLQVASDVVPVPTGPDGRDLVAWPPGQRALSVFPMRLVPGADPWAAQQAGWDPPTVIVPLVGSAQSSPTPSPSSSAAPSTSAGASPTPSATP